MLLLPVSECPLGSSVLCSAPLEPSATFFEKAGCYILNVHEKPRPFHYHSSFSFGHGLHTGPRYPVRQVSFLLAPRDIALGRRNMPCSHFRHTCSRSPSRVVSILRELVGVHWLLTLRGELAEDSLDVPSYIPAFMSAVIRYDWLSAAPSL
jgi:hypothetical protein